MKLCKMIEIYLQYENMHTIRTINVFICITNHINSCINSMLSDNMIDDCVSDWLVVWDVSYNNYETLD